MGIVAHGHMNSTACFECDYELGGNSSFFPFEVSHALNWRLDWCDLQNVFQPKFCHETLASSAF